MEKLRDHNHNFWSELFISITNDEYSHKVPIKIMKVLQEIDLKDFNSLENRRKIYDSLENEFIIFNILHYKKEQGLENLSLLEIDELKELLAWALFYLKNYQESTLDKERQILLILFIFSFLDKNLWMYIPREHLKNTALQEFLVRLFISFKFQYLESDQDSIWESEAIREYLHALKVRNWIILAKKWHIFGNNWRLDGNLFQKQILLYFFKSPCNFFVEQLNGYDEFILLMLLFRDHTFTLEQRFRLAYETDNELVCFALLFSLELNNLNYKELSDFEARIFSKSLKKVFDRKSALLDIWLKIFNEHLIRFPIFAKGFGIYLAKYANKSTLDSYLNSVEIYQVVNDELNASYGNQVRNIQTVVFKEFEKECKDIGKVNSFWRKCYLKWDSWSFSGQEYLFHITHSSFDYAVIKHLINKKAENIRLNVDQIFERVELSISDNWFLSESEYCTFINQNKSRMQVFCHANNILDGTEKLILVPIERVYSFTEITDIRIVE